MALIFYTSSEFVSKQICIFRYITISFQVPGDVARYCHFSDFSELSAGLSVEPPFSFFKIKGILIYCVTNCWH
jgi:hypothetical protein